MPESLLCTLMPESYYLIFSALIEVNPYLIFKFLISELTCLHIDIVKIFG